MDVSALFKGLQNLFEGSRFDVLPEDLQQFQRREIAYRDKEYCFHLLLSNYNYGEPPSIKVEHKRKNANKFGRLSSGRAYGRNST